MFSLVAGSCNQSQWLFGIGFAIRFRLSLANILASVVLG
jgi:hypothetical protein